MHFTKDSKFVKSRSQVLFIKVQDSLLLVPEVVPADVVQVVQEVVVVVLAVLAVLAAGGRVSPSYIAQSVILITSPSDKVYTNLGEKGQVQMASITALCRF